MKKVSSISAAILLAILTVVITSCNRNTNTCGPKVSWEYDETSQTLIISGTGNMYNYRDTTHAPWYEFKDDIKNVTISEGVTSIGNYAFSDCLLLNSVTIPKSVTSIGEHAFWECESLISINIPEGVTSIGAGAFGVCKFLSSVTIPESVTCIGSSTFMLCRSLSYVNIPKSVTKIDNGAFFGCGNIEYYGNAKGAPWGAKCYNGYIEGDFIYSDYTKAKLCIYNGDGGKVIIPMSVTSIGEYAFSYCKFITSVYIPVSVTSIGEYAFEECGNIEYYGNIEGAPWGAFCRNGYIEGDFIYSDYTKTKLCSYKGHDDKVGIPESVTTIGDFAFWRNIYLTSVTIPESVTSIGGCAFIDCKSLTSINIPESVTSIGKSAFSECASLKSITIPKNVTSIGGSAFSSCNSLTTVTIPESVTEIDFWAFNHCKNVTDVYCYAHYDKIIFNNMKENFNSSTKFHVYSGESNKWKEKYNDAQFTFVDDLK